MPLPSAPVLSEPSPCRPRCALYSGLKRKCADRNLQHDAFAFGSGSVRALAVPSALRLVLRVEAEVHQRVVLLAGFHQDIAATPAITARRTAARHKLFAAKSQAAVASSTGGHSYSGFIYEHCDLFPLALRNPLRPREPRAEERKKPRMTRLQCTEKPNSLGVSRYIRSATARMSDAA